MPDFSPTRIRDVIQPDLWTDYVIDRTAELSEVVRSGIARPAPELNRLIREGNTIINMPSWNDLTGDSHVMRDDDQIPVKGITSKVELATLLIRADAWGSHELAGALAGDDPMNAITQLVAEYWVREEQKWLLATLKGVFSSESLNPQGQSMQSLRLKTDGKISRRVVLRARNRLGDHAKEITAVMMHSDTYTSLLEEGLIAFVPNITSNIPPQGSVDYGTYLGMKVVIDDGLPVAADGETYTTYLFGTGVIQRAEAVPVAITPTEFDRDSLGSTDILINRKAIVLHPRGIKWKGAGEIDGVTPTNLELANGDFWQPVVELKKIRMVEIQHKVEVD